jgi:hypothetical protein
MPVIYLYSPIYLSHDGLLETYIILFPVHCPLLFVFVRCAVSVIGHFAVDSAY